MAELTQAPGFFGKLRTHGDFVSRRLPPAVRDCFDHWLQGALLHSRRELGDAWLPTWLSSPLWRFVVGAGVCGKQAWAGVMMPSHDRVGRCFPLLIAAPIDGTPSLQDCLALHSGWFAQIEDLALSTLEEGFTVHEFDAALLALNGSLCASEPSGVIFAHPPASTYVPAQMPLVADGAGVSAHLFSAPLEGRSAWWTEGSDQITPCVATCTGMPAPAKFAALLDGRWAARGWASLEEPGHC